MPIEPNPHARTDAVEGMSAVLFGAGFITMAIFPLAIPILLLTAVALIPLAIPALAATLVVGLVAAPVVLARRLRRKRAIRVRDPGERTAARAAMMGDVRHADAKHLA
jgi:membrane protein implicated in regulation of membrane protease activity